MIPETYWVLKRLGMLPRMQQSHVVKKYDVARLKPIVLRVSIMPPEP